MDVDSFQDPDEFLNEKCAVCGHARHHHNHRGFSMVFGACARVSGPEGIKCSCERFYSPQGSGVDVHIVGGFTREHFEKEFARSLQKLDPVKKPVHYNSHPSGIECIDIIKYFDFATGNAIKYLWRCGLKASADPIEDLEKAKTYIDFKIALIREEEARDQESR